MRKEELKHACGTSMKQVMRKIGQQEEDMWKNRNMIYEVQKLNQQKQAKKAKFQRKHTHRSKN